MINLNSALARTLLLMRDELDDSISEGQLVDALTSTRVALVADEALLSTLPGQAGLVTAFVLLARSGHQIQLFLPPVSTIPGQPLVAERVDLHEALLSLDGNLMPPRRVITASKSGQHFDLQVLFGDAKERVSARTTIRLSFGGWHAAIGRAHGELASARDWPFGALIGSVLVAEETFKIAMRQLQRFARSPDYFHDLFAPCSECELSMAPPDTPTLFRLGEFDLISAGAISNAFIYCLRNIPDASARVRVFDDDAAEVTNLNRNALLQVSQLGANKVDLLSGSDAVRFSIEGIPFRFENEATNGTLVSNVIVGTDDIPARWHVQRTSPECLIVGATSHWAAMASYHWPGTPCAACLHPEDEKTRGPIPTVAFVSFSAGLQCAAYYVRYLTGTLDPAFDQQTYFSPLRPENVRRKRVPFSPKCPIGHSR